MNYTKLVHEFLDQDGSFEELTKKIPTGGNDLPPLPPKREKDRWDDDGREWTHTALDEFCYKINTIAERWLFIDGVGILKPYNRNTRAQVIEVGYHTGGTFKEEPTGADLRYGEEQFIERTKNIKLKDFIITGPTRRIYHKFKNHSYYDFRCQYTGEDYPGMLREINGPDNAYWWDFFPHNEIEFFMDDPNYRSKNLAIKAGSFFSKFFQKRND